MCRSKSVTLNWCAYNKLLDNVDTVSAILARNRADKIKTAISL